MIVMFLWAGTAGSDLTHLIMVYFSLRRKPGYNQIQDIHCNQGIESITVNSNGELLPLPDSSVTDPAQHVPIMLQNNHHQHQIQLI